MKIISLINMKGGVGKSTVAVNLAFACAEKKRTLLVDIDPQFNATQYALGAARTEAYFKAKEKSVVDVFESPYLEPTDLPIKRIDENLDLLPSSLELNRVLKNPAQKEQRLQKFIKSHCPNYDWVIIDCPPTDSMLTLAAYLASDYLVIPVKPEYLSVIGLPLLLRSYNEFVREYTESKLRIAGIVVNWPNNNQRENRTAQRDIEEFALENRVSDI
jgi:chromosome partitioning protein